MPKRILFLVDRESLAKQALETIKDILPGYSIYWLKAGTDPTFYAVEFGSVVAGNRKSSNISVGSLNG